MREIPLTNMQVTSKVDNVDYWRCCKHEWFGIKSRNTYYAKRYYFHRGKKILQSLQDFLMGKPRKGYVNDHKDRDGLNNQRSSNLRLCTLEQNSYNRTNNMNGKFKYKGVRERDGKYYAEIVFKKKKHRSKLFDTILEAAEQYDIMAMQYHKEHASLNFPEKIMEYMQREISRHNEPEIANMYLSLKLNYGEVTDACI